MLRRRSNSRDVESGSYAAAQRLLFGQPMRSLVVLLLLVATAHADPPGMTAPAEPPVAQDTDSYRWQTALSDAAAVAMFVVAAKSEDGDAAATIGLGVYVAGGPIVHLIHHHNGRAVASLALRVALPLIAGAIGAGIASGRCTDEDCDDPFAGLGGALVGAVVGAGVASAIDIGYLSRGEDAPATRPQPIPPPTPIGPAEPHQVRVGMTFAF